MKKALITGGAGFMGSHIAAHLLARGYRVDLVDNFSRGARDETIERLASQPGVALRAADLRDGSSLGALPADYTHVYHLAAIIGVQGPAARLDAKAREAALPRLLDAASRLSARLGWADEHA